MTGQATTTLADRIPAGTEPGQVADLFIDWTAEQDLELYEAQEEAILEILGGSHVILATPTGSGKSLVATAAHAAAMARGERSIYTAPIKALVSEKFFALARDFGPENVGMVTGDARTRRSSAPRPRSSPTRPSGRAPTARSGWWWPTSSTSTVTRSVVGPGRFRSWS